MCEISVEAITKDINERMATHTNSMCATDDEVSMAYLLCEIDTLKTKINDAENCLVCAGIATPIEVCENTLAILAA